MIELSINNKSKQDITLDNQNELNTTQAPAQTRNPQSSANPGASNASDFQSTAPPNALNQEAENLSVQETGDPISGTVQPASESFPVTWTIAIIVVVIASVWLLVKLFKEEVEEMHTPAVAAKKPAASVAAKKSAKKIAPKKKTVAKARKKSSKKKR